MSATWRIGLARNACWACAVRIDRPVKGLTSAPVSVRLVTNDLNRFASFYTMPTGVAAKRLHPEFTEIRLEGAILAISTELPIQQFNVGAAITAANRSAIFEFQVDDVNGVHNRLSGDVECVMGPMDMPWGIAR